MQRATSCLSQKQILIYRNNFTKRSALCVPKEQGHLQGAGGGSGSEKFTERRRWLVINDLVQFTCLNRRFFAESRRFCGRQLATWPLNGPNGPKLIPAISRTRLIATIHLKIPTATFRSLGGESKPRFFSLKTK